MSSISDKIRQSVPLAPFTTMRVGGPAAYFVEPATIPEVINSLAWAREKKLPVFVMGRGSNLIVSDTGYAGLIIRLNGAFSKMEWEGSKVRVYAGTPLEELIVQANQRGRGGLERLIGIPGSVGGALCMNAGAFDQSASDRLISVTSIVNGELVKRSRKEMEFSYRKSPFSGNGETIVEAEFDFLKASSDALQKESETILEKRKAKQPWNVYCAGSTFKRPPGGFAGTLIEEAGLKGRRMGGAEVSSLHAGFIVNTGTATAMDIHRLTCLVIETVEKKHGVRLEPEVIFLGEFHE